MGKTVSVNDRIKELRKELNYKTEKKKKFVKLEEINVKKYKKKKRKNDLKKYNTIYRGYLKSLSESEIEEELENIEYMYSFPTEKEIYERNKREEKLNKQKEKDFKEYLKQRNPKTISDYDKCRKKFYSKEIKKRKMYKKKGLNINDAYFTTLALDENKMIKNLKRISKENKKRTDVFLDYVDKLYNGEDVPDIVRTLKDKSKDISKANKKYIESLEDCGLNPGIKF